MKKIVNRSLVCILIVALLGATFVGCAKKNTNINAQEVVNELLTKVNYSTKLSKVEKNAELYFSDLPEGTTVELYIGGGYYADELALLTLDDESKGEDALNVVKTHIEELKKQFLNYVPAEVGKIDNAVVSQKGKYIFVCITNDYKTAKDIISKGGKEASSEGNNKVDNTQNIATNENDKNNLNSNNEETQKENYPILKSKSGTYHEYKGASIKVDNSGFELYNYVDSSAQKYADLVSKTAKALNGKTKVYALAIPTSIGIILPDDIKEKLSNYSDQDEAIKKIFSKMSQEVIPVNCYNNLMKHRDEYLYFRTDYHWNGRGAFYAYESFCNKKGIKAIPLEEREEKKFDGFLGELYWKNSNKDSELGNTPDTVYAYCPKSTTATMEYTDNNGKTYPWKIVCDVSKYKASTKYSTFAAGDNPITVFKNPEVKDNSVLVIVKESYGNALLPYLVDHYSTIYEVDYRYYNGNLIDLAKEKGANDLIFANNLSMIRSNYLIGKLSGIIG